MGGDKSELIVAKEDRMGFSRTLVRVVVSGIGASLEGKGVESPTKL